VLIIFKSGFVSILMTKMIKQESDVIKRFFIFCIDLVKKVILEYEILSASDYFCFG